MLNFRLCAGQLFIAITSLDAETGDKQAEWLDNKILITGWAGTAWDALSGLIMKFWKLILQLDLHLSTPVDTTEGYMTSLIVTL